MFAVENSKLSQITPNNEYDERIHEYCQQALLNYSQVYELLNNTTKIDFIHINSIVSKLLQKIQFIHLMAPDNTKNHKILLAEIQTLEAHIKKLRNMPMSVTRIDTIKIINLFLTTRKEVYKKEFL